MYSASTFDVWRSELTALGLSIPDLIGEELNDRHEAYSGWNEQGLLDLFAMDIGIDHGREGSDDVGNKRHWQYCSDCRNCFSDNLHATRFQVQPFWRHTLERLKAGLPVHPFISHAPMGDLPYSASIGTSNALVGLCEGSKVPDFITEDSYYDSKGPSLNKASNSGPDIHICTIFNPHRYPPAISKSERYIYKEGDKIRKPLSLYYEEDLASKSDICKGCNPHGYPKNVSIHEKCIYGPYEKVCLHCWLYYIQYGSRHPRVKKRAGYLGPCRCTSLACCWCDPCEWYDGTDDVNDFFPAKDISDDEDEWFSPYHIHT